jgi:hypothetical protein
MSEHEVRVLENFEMLDGVVGTLQVTVIPSYGDRCQFTNYTVEKSGDGYVGTVDAYLGSAQQTQLPQLVSDVLVSYVNRLQAAYRRAGITVPPTPSPEEHECDAQREVADTEKLYPRGYGAALTEPPFYADGEWWAGNGEYYSIVRFCPWCGEDLSTLLGKGRNR